MKKSFKAVVALILLCAMILVPAAAFAAKDINVTVFGEQVKWTDAKPFADQNNRTLVPLRAVANALDLIVDWNGKEAIFKQYMIEPSEETGGHSEHIEIRFPVNSNEAHGYAIIQNTNGDYYEEQDLGPVYMDTAAVSKNGRTYAPARYLAEFFGYKVGWDGATSTVTIDWPPSALSYNFETWELAYMDANTATFYRYPNADWDKVAKFTVRDILVNGASVPFEENEKVEMVPEGVDPADCMAYFIDADFSDPANTSVDFDIVVTTTDGNDLYYTITLSGFYY